MLVRTVDLDVFLAVAGDGMGEIKDLGKGVTLADVFERAGIILGREKVIAVSEAEALADIFEGVGMGPADADGFFGEGKGLAALGVDVFFGFDPVDLVGHEVTGEDGGGVEVEGGEDGGHRGME